MKKIIFLALMVLFVLGLSTALVSATGEGPTITVHKFNDLDGDGIWDDGEPVIPGWEIRLYKVHTDGTIALWGEGFTNDPDGTVIFTGLYAGYEYLVWEAGAECWQPTTPTGLGQMDGGYYTVVDFTSSYEVYVKFGNVDTCVPPPPPDGEGCTPGFWKNKKRLPLWPLDPDDDFDTTFGVDLFDPDITLGEAVRAKGGGVNKLARHGTAALLNAFSGDVDYPLTEAEVIAAVQAGDADTLVEYNELLAPGFCD